MRTEDSAEKSLQASCYLCESKSSGYRKGVVRDREGIAIHQCSNCGLVFLSSFSHIGPNFYEESGMHGGEPTPIPVWLKDTDSDDRRRFAMFRAMLANKRVLDFGCGAAGFLQHAMGVAAEVTGIELENRIHNYWEGQIEIRPNVPSAREGRAYDVITAFHVIEHLSDPRGVLKSLANLLDKNGRIIVEVPNSDDALLTLYDCDSFQHFTYWSQHLFLFNAKTLEMVARQAGLRVVAVQHYQRYTLSNHLFWLSQGKPGGHKRWSFLDTPEMTEAYSHALAAIGKTDTLIAHLERWY